MLRPYDSGCPAYSKLREADRLTDEYKRVEEDNQVCGYYMYVYLINAMIVVPLSIDFSSLMEIHYVAGNFLFTQIFAHLAKKSTE